MSHSHRGIFLMVSVFITGMSILTYQGRGQLHKYPGVAEHQGTTVDMVTLTGWSC